MKKKKKVFISAAAIIVLAGAGLWILGGKKSNQTISFATSAVHKGSISNSITATGTIEPVTEVEVGTQVSGIIDKIYVDYNSVVKAGQVIAEMDRVTLISDLQSAQATYDGAEAEYNYQEKLYERNKTLHSKQLISDTEYEQYEYNYRRAKSTYDQSKAALAKAQRNLSYTIITSPINGVVTSREVEEGQTVASGFETPTLFTIAADLTKMQVVADVDEADIAGVKDSAKVTFTVDAYPDDVFEGRVKQIRLGSTNSSSSSTSTTSETVVTYEVVITADNPDLKLKPRLTANITIYTMERNDVLSIPNKALRFIADASMLEPLGLTVENPTMQAPEGKRLVWVEEGTQLKPKAITVGSSNNNVTEVVDGLQEGEIVAVDLSVSTPVEVSPAAGQERSPFMPGPPDSKKGKK